ncbi:acyl-CoA dehydrogenase [Spongiibacter sp. KMU-166]|uniref:Acyl-CoA dehydrogenase n=1 Tax=Spongiibacter thalassae TaxID=2721624 RepID=A0ABX1GI61_9GAMM|nr:acyl-CoA dehydrogenase family protein [Spongiibacter thalassae]NKI18630.1 acyl-CoA dehydrogenase [Spongiibacter thalassae]
MTNRNSLVQFRSEVRTFLANNLSENMRRSCLQQASIFSDFDAASQWQKILADRGWGAPAWPVEYGGTGWSAEQYIVFQQECARADTPQPFPLGLQMLGPILMRFGSPEQKARFLPSIVSGEDVWCQGFSEPNAGSDLAALSTKAHKEGGDYVINGTKIWTSFAHRANRMFLLARTSSESARQTGISFFLVDDLRANGITITPIVSLDGEVEQCQVFFDNLRLPASALVGKEGDGWEITKALLKEERGGYLYYLAAYRQLKRLRALVDATPDCVADHHYRQCFSRLTARALSLKSLELRVVAQDDSAPESSASLCKLEGTRLSQDIDELARYCCGLQFGQTSQAEYSGLERDALEGISRHYLNNRAATLYGGSSQIQKTLIARSLQR